MTCSLIDSFGRTINYLRLSITDRCNLRCLYCMPKEGVNQISHNEVLRFEEMLKICRILGSLGIRTVRVTGGEPLVRKGTADLIKELKNINGIERVTMTSNGVLLGENLNALAEAKLDGINISLDTLDAENFCRLTSGKDFGNILRAIEKALNLGIDVKINCVPLCDFNEKEIAKIAALAKDKNIAVRFIELMPLGEAALVKPLSAQKVFSIIEETHGTLQPITIKAGSGPASYYKLQGFTGNIGIISARDKNYCNNCNRLRLTAAGFLTPCLASNMGTNLKKLVRGGASGEEIAQTIKETVNQKPEGFDFSENKNDDINMYRIGG